MDANEFALQSLPYQQASQHVIPTRITNFVIYIIVRSTEAIAALAANIRRQLAFSTR